MRRVPEGRHNAQLVRQRSRLLTRRNIHERLSWVTSGHYFPGNVLMPAARSGLHRLPLSNVLVWRGEV